MEQNRHNIIAFPGAWQPEAGEAPDADGAANARIERIVSYVEHLEHSEEHVEELTTFLSERRHDGMGGAALFECLKEYLQAAHPALLRQIHTGRL